MSLLSSSPPPKLLTITKVPHGKYLLRALHSGVSSINRLIREVTAGKSEIVPVNFVVDSPRS